jgi:quercetin dioxygenase-like cupin family protein
MMCDCPGNRTPNEGGKTEMKAKHVMAVTLSAALIAVASALALGGGRSVVTSNADVKWKDMGIPGVAAAPVSGDMEKGASRFFLKYPAGFVSPNHHHTADHYVAVISGTLLLTVDGKETKLRAGSYFALMDKAPHVAKVEGGEPAVMFIEAEGPWDVVMEK